MIITFIIKESRIRIRNIQGENTTNCLTSKRIYRKITKFLLLFKRILVNVLSLHKIYTEKYNPLFFRLNFDTLILVCATKTEKQCFSKLSRAVVTLTNVSRWTRVPRFVIPNLELLYVQSVRKVQVGQIEIFDRRDWYSTTLFYGPIIEVLIRQTCALFFWSISLFNEIGDGCRTRPNRTKYNIALKRSHRFRPPYSRTHTSVSFDRILDLILVHSKVVYKSITEDTTTQTPIIFKRVSITKKNSENPNDIVLENSVEERNKMNISRTT